MHTELIAPLPFIINSIYLASILFIVHFTVTTLVGIIEFISHTIFHRREIAELKKMRKTLAVAGKELEEAMEAHICVEEKFTPVKRSRSQSRRITEVKKTV